MRQQQWPARNVLRQLEHARRRRRVAQVGFDAHIAEGCVLAAVLVILGRQVALRCLEPQVGDGDLEAVARQRARRRQTDPVVPAGDEGDAVRQP